VPAAATVSVYLYNHNSVLDTVDSFAKSQGNQWSEQVPEAAILHQELHAAFGTGIDIRRHIGPAGRHT
jgi:hypothetical protein